MSADAWKQVESNHTASHALTQAISVFRRPRTGSNNEAPRIARRRFWPNPPVRRTNARGGSFVSSSYSSNIRAVTGEKAWGRAV